MTKEEIMSFISLALVYYCCIKLDKKGSKRKDLYNAYDMNFAASLGMLVMSLIYLLISCFNK